MEFPVLNLPLDDTGTLETHYREETHPISSELANLVYPELGPYFLGSMTVYDQNNAELKPQIDWEPILHYRQATTEVGQAIWRCLIIKDPKVTSVKITYQLIGGVYMNSNIAFEQLLIWFQEYKSIVYWDDVIKPESGFKPIDHSHYMPTDLMGTQELVGAVNRVADVIIDWLNGQTIEIEDVNLLREALDGLGQEDEQIRLTIQQLQENLTTLQQNLATTDQNIVNLADALTTTNQNVSSNLSNINTLAERADQTDQQFVQVGEELQTLDTALSQLNQALATLGETVDNQDYGVLTVTGPSTTVTRLRRSTVVDITRAGDTTLSLDLSAFALHDTLVVNIPRVDTGTVTMNVLGGHLVLDLQGQQQTQLVLSGSGYLELRSKGNVNGVVTMQMIKLG